MPRMASTSFFSKMLLKASGRCSRPISTHWDVMGQLGCDPGCGYKSMAALWKLLFSKNDKTKASKERLKERLVLDW